MPKLFQRFPALFQRKPTQHPKSYVSYAPEVLVDEEDIETSPAFQRDFPASFAAAKAKAKANEAAIEAPANGDVVSSDMISSNAVGFVEMAFKSVSCNLLARANEQTCMPKQLSHTSFPSTSFSTGIDITWEVYGDETGVESSAVVVVAGHAVNRDHGNDVDVFLSFVFQLNTAVEAVIQYGDGESAHEVVLERFRMTGEGGESHTIPAVARSSSCFCWSDSDCPVPRSISVQDGTANSHEW